MVVWSLGYSDKLHWKMSLYTTQVVWVFKCTLIELKQTKNKKNTIKLKKKIYKKMKSNITRRVKTKNMHKWKNSVMNKFKLI